MTLSDMKPGEQAIIKKVRGNGPLKRRFMDMGIVEGTKLDYIKVAPLGDPLQISVKSYELSIRKEDAANIEVELR